MQSKGLFEGQDERAAAKAKHEFWDNQPMPNRFNEETPKTVVPELVDNRLAVNISPERLPLQDPLEWCDEAWEHESLEAICKEVNTLSNEGTQEETLSFNPDISFLMWSMSPPGMLRQYLVGFRHKQTRKLLGFICGLPLSVSISGAVVEKAIEIKNLFIHPSLRGMRLAPLLISEVSRRVRYNGHYIALYTSSVTITRPLCKARYYQRPINLSKLLSVRFKELSRGQTLARSERRLEQDVVIPNGWRKMEERDAKEAHALLTSYLSRFVVHQVMSFEEFKYWFINPHPSVSAYVVEGRDESIKAFCCWHVLEAHVTSNAGQPTVVKGAFSHYIAGDDLSRLYQWQVAQMKLDGVDVLMCLDIGGMEDVLLDFEASKAEVSPEYLLYHLYNFKALPCDDNSTFNICFF